MATTGAKLDSPLLNESAQPGRIDSVDLLRGLVMAIMALDHTRDYFTNLRFAPEDLSQTYGALFFTRWITHFCAPTFFFLAGTGMFLSRKRGWDLSKFLVTRGIWLVFLELTLISFAWTFTWSIQSLFSFLVIWALGWSMVALAGLVRLPVQAVAVIGVGMIVFHNLFDKVTPAIVSASMGKAAGLLWAILHQPGFHLLNIEGAPARAGFFVLYPLIPWVGVMATGFAFGAMLQQPAEQRRRNLFILGASMFAAFLVLRLTNVYGNPPVGFGFASPGPFEVQKSAELTVIAVLNVEKYPPSLQYLLMTLGGSIMALSMFDRVDLKSIPGKLWEKILIFGRVPMFYYICHLFVIHLMAVAIAPLYGQPIKWLFQGGPFNGTPEGYGHGLPFIYLMWIIALVILYFPCKWYADLKQRRKDLWWLSYI
jgi:uncharacterized membrane protein